MQNAKQYDFSVLVSLCWQSLCNKVIYLL